MTIAIIIPARWASARFPGKPLAMLGGETMLAHVVKNSKAACAGLNDTLVAVATDDERIAKHCADLNVQYVMTPPECPTGSDRVYAAVKALNINCKFAVNMQGDGPFTPPDFVRAMIDAYNADSEIDVVTPVVQLAWDALDKLRESKKTTPFSGTTAILGANNQALWFSKNIIPAMRKEDKLREAGGLSPVYRHIGLYGFKFSALEKFIALPESPYEKLEGLEQLRILENAMTIRAVIVDYKGRPSMSGIDSPEDLVRAEALLAKMKTA